MAKIITVTANTAIDMHIEVTDFKAGGNLIANSSIEFAAGKGVNVSKAVAAMGVTSIAAGFVGRKSINKFELLQSPLFITCFTPVPGRTRTNITICDTQSETHLRTSGYQVHPQHCELLLQQLQSIVLENDILILSGSLPQGAPKNLYHTLVEIGRTHSAKTFLDSSGEALSLGIKAHPYLINPNLHEWEILCGRKMDSDAEIVTAAKNFINNGTELICVSKGADGAVFVDKTGYHSARLISDVVAPISSIGCGDAMLAAFAVATVAGLNVKEMLCWGLAVATANLHTPEPGTLDYCLVRKYLPLIDIQYNSFS